MHRLAVAVAVVGGLAGADAALYDEVLALIARHGFYHPPPAGSGWDAIDETAVAVSAVYAWVPTIHSPPVLQPGTNDADEIIKCTAEPTACTLDTTKIGVKTPSPVYKCA